MGSSIGVGSRTFEVRDPCCDGDDWHEVRASDARDAAVGYAEHVWSRGDPFTSLELEVREKESMSMQRIDVTVESEPVFRAHMARKGGSRG